MPALFFFLLKVNLALIAFCLGYYLVLRKLTFYTLNRFYLVLGIIFSSFYPFVNIDSIIQRYQQLVPVQQAITNLKVPAEKLLHYAWYWNWAAMIFWIGAAVFAMRLVIQFISLYKIYRNSTPDMLEQYEVRITDADISPFSFWRSIFINPDNIEAADLKNILQHEQVHVSEWHTLDILLAEISVVFYWFNPGIWFMKKAVTENIEFITDRKILQNGMDSKAYQYSLLNVSLGTSASPNITNHFNFSTLKKRIWMMNARRSSNVNLTRYALLVPAVVICLCAFSISKANIVDKSKMAYRNISTSVQQIIGGPIAEVTIKPRKRLHKLMVHLIDTAQKPEQPMIFQFKNDSIAHSNQTFEARKIKGEPAAYFINGKPVSAEEFQTRRPHVKMDTVNIIANYNDIHKPRNVFFAIRLKDHPGTKGGDTPSTPDAVIDGKPIESIRTVENVVLTPPTKDSVPMLNGRAIHSIRINGKNISKTDLNKLPPAAIAKATVIDDHNTPQSHDIESHDIDITSIRKVRLNGKEISKDELNKLPASMLESIHVVDRKKASGDSVKEDSPTTFKRTWDVEMTTKKQQ